MIRVPGDKSITHRALILSAVATGRSRLRGLLSGEDCQSTASALRALGAGIPELPDDGSEIVVDGVGLAGLRTPGSVLDCGNSGTTVRLLLGLLSGINLEALLTGDESLRARPMRRVTGPLGELGASFWESGAPDRLPVRVRGRRLRSARHPLACRERPGEERPPSRRPHGRGGGYGRRADALARSHGADAQADGGRGPRGCDEGGVGGIAGTAAAGA